MLANLRLILNGKSIGRQDVREAVTRLRETGVEIDVRVTWEAGDAARFARETLPDCDWRIVAAGGDGTVNEVLCGVLTNSLQPAFGILPLGTANDFASSAGIPSTCFEALQLAATADPVVVDVGEVNGKPFLNIASGGFGAAVTSGTPKRLKDILGGTAYALSAIIQAMHASPYKGRLVVDGQVHDGSMIMMAVGNGRQAGGGASMTPHAVINDGLLDIMVIPDQDNASFTSVIEELANIKLGNNSHFIYTKGRTVMVQSEQELQFNLDGEPIKGHEFSFGVRPASLRLIVPPHCALLRV